MTIFFLRDIIVYHLVIAILPETNNTLMLIFSLYYAINAIKNAESIYLLYFRSYIGACVPQKKLPRFYFLFGFQNPISVDDPQLKPITHPRHII